jgi:hypothetical protein
MFSYLRNKWFGTKAHVLQSSYDEFTPARTSVFSTTYYSFASIIKSVGRTLTTLNPVSVFIMLSTLQMFLVEAQSDDTLVLEAPSNGTLTNMTLVQNNVSMNASALAFVGSNFSNINISDYFNLPTSLFLTVSNLVLDFPGNGSTYSAVAQNDLQPIADRFGTQNASYLFKPDSYFYAQDYDLPTFIPQTLSWWMRNGTAGSIINYGINVQINQQYLNNQSGSAYACPGENGYLSIAYGSELVCGGWLNSPLNANLYLGYGPNNTWSQYVLTLDDSYDITIYINGSALIGNLTKYSEPSSPFTSPFFTIGYQFNGELDTLRIYSRALNASEILANFRAESTPPAANVTLLSSTGMFSSSARSSSSSSNNVGSSSLSSSASSSVSSSVASSSVSSSASSSVASSSISSSVTSNVPSSSTSSSVTSNVPSSSASSSITSNGANSFTSNLVHSSSTFSSTGLFPADTSSSSNSANATSNSSNSSSFPNAAVISLPIGLTALLMAGGTGLFARHHHDQPKQKPCISISVTAVSKLRA